MIFLNFELCMVQKWIKIMDLILVFLYASLIIRDVINLMASLFR